MPLDPSDDAKLDHSSGALYHRDVNWLTTSLVILREIVITIAICYPSSIFIQIIKINKRKYISYSTKCNMGFMRLKGLTQV